MPAAVRGFPEIGLGGPGTAVQERPDALGAQTHPAILRACQPSPECWRAPPPGRSARLPDATSASRGLRETAAESRRPESGSPSLQAEPLAPSALHAHCRTEPAAPARDRDVFPKPLPGGDGSKTAKTFKKTPEGNPSSESSFAFLPCPRPGTRATPAPQGGRPKGRTAESLGGQPCPNSGARRSRWLASSWPTAATNTVDRSL